MNKIRTHFLALSALLLTGTGVAHAVDYDLYVKGTRVTSSNASNILGDGHVSYNASTKTLTLSSATISHTGQMAAIRNVGIDGLNINVVGSNTISSNGYIISSIKSMNFTGTGSLKLSCTSDGSYSAIDFDPRGENTTCVINGPQITINCDGAFSGSYSDSNTVTVTGTTTSLEMNVTSSNGVCYLMNGFTIGSYLGVTAPASCYYSTSMNNFTTDGSSRYVGKVVIGAPLMYVGETRVTPSNAGDILGDGHFRFDYASKTLYITNADLTNKDGSLGSCISNREFDDLTICFTGNNFLTARNSAISSNRSFSITGSTGVVRASSTDSYAFSISGPDLLEVVCTVDGPMLSFDGKSYALNSYSGNGKLVVNGSTTSVSLQPGSGYRAINNLAGLTMGSGVKICEPEGGTYSSSLKTVTTNGSSAYIGKVVISTFTGDPIYIGGTWVTPANAKDVLGDGTVSYNADSKTLTLHNARITDNTIGTMGLGAFGIDGLNIKVEGYNTVTSPGALGLVATRNFSITGTGTLQINAPTNDAVNLWSKDGDDINCTIDGPSVVLISANNGSFSGSSGYKSTVTVKGTSTQVYMQPEQTEYGNAALDLIDDFQVGSDLCITEPYGAYYDAKLKNFTLDGTTIYYGGVVVGPAVDCGFYVAETRVKSSNANDILGDGAFRYDAATKTLYVRNASLSNQDSLGSGISNREVEGMTIVFEGTNTFTTRMACIGCQKSTTIIGSGTLNATSTNAYGLLLTGSGTVCTVGGPTLNIRANTNGICGYIGEGYADGQTLVVYGDSTLISLECTNSYKYKIIEDLSSLVLRGDIAITEPQGAWFDSSLKSVTVNGTDAYRDRVVISKYLSQDYIVVETEDSVDVCYHITGDNTVEVGAESGNAVGDNITEVEIPDTVGDYTVTGVGANAFEWNYGLTTVYLPATIETIGYGAFFNCGNLYNVYMRSRQAPTLLDIDGNPTTDNNAFAGLPSNMPGDATTYGARSLGDGVTNDEQASSASIPSKIHAPPKGSGLMQNLVSPRCHSTRDGPMPISNSFTRIPLRLAIA